MKDLIWGIGLISVGVSGMIAAGVIYHKIPQWGVRMERLRKRSDLQLHAELTRYVGNIADATRHGDRKGIRSAQRAMRPIVRVLKERCRANAKRKTAHAAT